MKSIKTIKAEIAASNLIIHLEKGTVGAFGLVSHSYRQAACGVRAERWLTTSNTDWSDVRYVNCKKCMRTRAYKDKCNVKHGHLRKS